VARFFTSSPSIQYKKVFTKCVRIRKTVSFWSLLFFAIIWIIPLLWLFSTSFKSSYDLTHHVIALVPYHPTLENYTRLFNQLEVYPIFNWLGNSAISAVIYTLLYGIIATGAAYVFGVLKWKGRNLVFTIILISMVIPGIMNFIPIFQMTYDFGWIPDASDPEVATWPIYLNYIIPGLGGTFGLFIIRQFFMSIPYELVEAAKMEGANDLKILTTVVFPLGKNAVLVACLFAFMGNWNDYMWPSLVNALTFNNKYALLQVGLGTMQNISGYDYGFVMSATIISIIPIFIVFLFVQSKIIDGVARTGIK
jgi:multiple sugar transport system permease protein